MSYKLKINPAAQGCPFVKSVTSHEPGTMVRAYGFCGFSRGEGSELGVKLMREIKAEVKNED